MAKRGFPGVRKTVKGAKRESTDQQSFRHRAKPKPRLESAPSWRKILQDFARIPFCRITLPVLGLGMDPWVFAKIGTLVDKLVYQSSVADVALLYGLNGVLPALVCNTRCEAVNLEIDSAVCSDLRLNPY